MSSRNHWHMERKPRRDDPVDVHVERLDGDGHGLASFTAVIAGEPRRLRFSVPGALPGEQAHVAVSSVHRNDVEAAARALGQRSASRVAPRCPHALDLQQLPEAAPGVTLAAACGGCSLQHLAVPAQERAKAHRLALTLGLGERLRPVLGSPEAFAYRNKLELSCGRAVDAPVGSPVSLGLRPRGYRHELIPLSTCAIMAPGTARLIPLLGRWLGVRGLTATQRDGDGAFLRTVTFREGRATGDRLVDLGSTDAPSAQLDGAWVAADVVAAAFAEAAVALGREVDAPVSGVVWTRRLASSGRRTTFSTQTLYGRPSVIERLALPDGPLELELGPRAFFQPNTAAAERLYALIVEAATQGGRPRLALDLFCGVGGIGLALARRCEQVLGVELVPEAIDAARVNARRNGLENIRFEVGEVGAVLAQAALPVPEVVVVDPPRAGLERGLAEVVALGAPRLVYVSCNPEALARDLSALRAAGYHARWAQPVDQFPHTPHVEVVALLEREPQPA